MNLEQFHFLKPCDDHFWVTFFELIWPHQTKWISRIFYASYLMIWHSNPCCLTLHVRTQHSSLRSQTWKHSSQIWKSFRHQNHWLWIRVFHRWANLHIHSKQILLSSRDHTRHQVWVWNWYVEFCLHSLWALHRDPTFYWGRWISIAFLHNGDKRSSTMKSFSWGFKD